MHNAIAECKFAFDSLCKEVLLYTMLECLDFQYSGYSCRGINTRENKEAVAEEFAGELHLFCRAVMILIDR